MKINFNPSKKELESVFGYSVLIECLNSSGILKPGGGILCKSDIRTPKRKWVIAHLDKDFSFPVQIPSSKSNQVKLYTFDKKAVYFTEENACCVIVMYFYSMLWSLRSEIEKNGFKDDLTRMIYGVTSNIYLNPKKKEKFKKLNEKARETLQNNGALHDAIYVLD